VNECKPLDGGGDAMQPSKSFEAGSIRYIDMVIYHIDMVILNIDMGYGLLIWEMTVSIWSSPISILDISSL